MLLFSLEELDKIFGEVNFQLVRKVNSDIKEIRAAYREKIGFIKALRLTNKKIFRAFFVYHIASECSIYHVDVFTDWDEFVDRCIESTDLALLDGCI